MNSPEVTIEYISLKDLRTIGNIRALWDDFAARLKEYGVSLSDYALTCTSPKYSLSVSNSQQEELGELWSEVVFEFEQCVDGCNLDMHYRLSDLVIPGHEFFEGVHFLVFRFENEEAEGKYEHLIKQITIPRGALYNDQYEFL